MTDQTSLLDLPEIQRPRRQLAAAWRERLRAALVERYLGGRVSADHAVALMEERPELRRPPEVHRNAIAPLLQAWDRAEKVGWVRSPRGRNLIAEYRLR